MAIFDAVDTARQLMDMMQTDVNYERELWKQEISFAFMTGVEEGTSYSLTENYRTHDLELRYHIDGQEPVVLASKPLPSGSNFCRRVRLVYPQHVRVYPPVHAAV